jgi:putative ABC transport system permease protein
MNTPTRAPHISPPRFAERLSGWLAPRDMRESFLGDLAEQFQREAADRGVLAARVWYWHQALRTPVAFMRQRDARVTTDRGDTLMTSLATDVRIAFRTFARRPGFSAVVVLTAALGIGAATTIFSAANPILFAPLPYPNADRIVVIKQSDNGAPGSRLGYATIVDVREQSHAFAAVAAIGGWQATVTGNGTPVQFAGLRVTPDYFSVLGVHPAIGRDFRREEDVAGAPRTVILAHNLWRTRFNGDSTLVGRTITLNDYPYLVVGVMPAGFEDVGAPAVQAWRPLQYNVSLPYACRTCQHLVALGRLREGMSVSSAAGELDALLGRLGREHQAEYPEHVGAAAVSLGEDLTKSVRPAMLATLGAVVLVLLIACVNVTNLLLGRVAERRSELAVRAALGASRARIVRQLLAESALLGTAGGMLGVALAWLGVRTLVQLAPPGLPRVHAMHVNGPVLALALAATTLVGIGFGLFPALTAARSDLSEGMQGASRRTVGASRRARSTLVVAEMALAVLVLAGSGLLLQSMRRLLDVRPGFDPRGVLSLQVQVVGQRFAQDTVVWRYFDRVLAAVRALPGVDDAALTSQLPLSGDFDAFGIHSERHPRANSQEDPSAHRYAITPGFLETMRIPLVRGRTFGTADNAGAPMVVMINESFARKYFPNEDVIGQRVRVGAADGGPWRTIVGVIGDIRQMSLAGGVSDAVYVPETQWANTDGTMSLVVRTRGNPAGLAESVRNAVWGVDKDQPIVRVASMSAVLASSAAERRFVLSLFELFALLAIVLAALGMYGVLAASVTERVREIGVREALGATPRDIMSMIVRQGMLLAGAGAVIGIALSLAGTRAIADQLFETSRVDPVTYAAALAALVFVALAACAVPAARAARVDPLESLRAQ